MNENLYSEVDQYISSKVIEADYALAECMVASAAAGLPSISVAPNQGKMLHLLARLGNARRILEIGTLGGYSTIWLARALPPDGRLITLEFEPRHAEVARTNLARAGLLDKVEVRVGRAIDLMDDLIAQSEAPFDLIFIDADKQGNQAYVERSLQLTRPGSAIVVDNVVRQGQVADESNNDPKVIGTRALFDYLSSESRLSATAVQTVGSKGHDGFVLAIVIQ